MVAKLFLIRQNAIERGDEAMALRAAAAEAKLQGLEPLTDAEVAVILDPGRAVLDAWHASNGLRYQIHPDSILRTRVRRCTA